VPVILARWVSEAFWALTRSKQAAHSASPTGSRRAEAASICRTPGGIGQQIISRAEPPQSDTLESVPRFDWIPDDPADGKSKKASKPEDMVGMKGRMNGVPHKIDSILGQGDNKVVFNLLNLETGRQMALAMSLTSFDPRRVLAAYLESQGERRYDAEEFIEHCDRVLDRFPDDHIAAFNKGVALFTKRQFKEANAVLEIALASAPGDLYTLVYKASALSGAEEHCKAVECLAGATKVDAEGTRKVLRKFTAQRELLLGSVQEVLGDDSSGPIARELLATVFS
jgi:tetratricopeptide (TPR) repeat protein